MYQIYKNANLFYLFIKLFTFLSISKLNPIVSNIHKKKDGRENSATDFHKTENSHIYYSVHHKCNSKKKPAAKKNIN